MDAKEQRRKRDREQNARMTDEERQESKERKRKRDRERNARMTDEERQESKELKRKRNKKRNERTTDEERQDQLKKRCEAYHQKINSGKTPEQKAAKCIKEKQKYANMKPKQKKARIEQIEARRQLECSTPSKDSIAMENPKYVATKQEVSISKFTAKHISKFTAKHRV
uniref:Uncharacterized protein n=1 Tax=Aegilops tauschii subsp. strangulata TaxID=200361 RepID=A0A453BJF0_AEGTS